MTALSASMKNMPEVQPYNNNMGAVNSKLLEQASTHEAQISALQSLLTKNQDAQEYYCRQALPFDMVPPRRRHRVVSSEGSVTAGQTNTLSARWD